MSDIMVRFDDLRRYCEKRHCGSVPLEYIKQMPTIEAEPVRHGRWIPVDGEPYAKCSYCGEKHYGCATPYCDMCGAYMRKDGADNG